MDKTPEEKAVMIAEFAVRNPHEGELIVSGGGWTTCKKWLSSPEGEVAMMDRLWEERILPKYWHSGQDGSVMSCQLNNNGWRTPRVNVTSKFCKTRNAALQEAIMEMIGEGE